MKEYVNSPDATSGDQSTTPFSSTKSPFQGVYVYTPNESSSGENDPLPPPSVVNNIDSDSCSYLISSSDDDIDMESNGNTNDYNGDQEPEEDPIAVIDAEVSWAHPKTPVLPATTIMVEESTSSTSYRKHGWIGIGLTAFFTTIALIGIGIWQRQVNQSKANVSANRPINILVPTSLPSPLPTPMTIDELFPWDSLGAYHESLLQTVLGTVEAFNHPDNILDIYAWTTRGTPQFEALRFVAYQDGAVDGGGDMGYYVGTSATPLLLQRLALLVLYFSTGGGFSWNTIPSMPSSLALSVVENEKIGSHSVGPISNPEDWATPGVDECLWSGVVCDENNYQLTHIQLKEYGLMDRIPNEFWVWLPHLFHIDLSNNRLTGTLPYTIFWSGRSSATPLVSSQQAYLSELNHLDLSSNAFEGTLPNDLQGGRLLSLQVLNLGHNRFTGKLPTNYDKKTLEQLNLSNNKFMGTLPFDDWFDVKEANSLFWIDLGSNSLTGSIPDSLGEHTTLEFLSLQNNPLMDGSLPSHQVVQNLSSLKTLDLSDCGLRGNMTMSLASLLGMPKLERLSLSENELMGSIPTTKQVESVSNTILSPSAMQALNLGNNVIMGTIPPDLFGERLVNLGHLQLFGNQLQGSIPTASFNPNKLRVFWVHHNANLEGIMPCENSNEVTRNETDISLPQDYRADCWFPSGVTCHCCMRCF